MVVFIVYPPNKRHPFSCVFDDYFEKKYLLEIEINVELLSFY